MWIDELALTVRDANISGIADNVYVYALREGEFGCFFTTSYMGVGNNPEIPDMYKGPIQLVVRSTSMQAAMTQAQAISDFLSSQKKRDAGLAVGFSTATTVWKYVYPRMMPVVFARSDGAYYEASVNFDVCLVAVSS